MPQVLKDEIRLTQKKSGNKMTYTNFLSIFEALYSTDGSAKLRKKWNEVTIATSGKITSRQLRELQVNFLGCADEVKDTNGAEIQRILLQKLPPFMKT